MNAQEVANTANALAKCGHAVPEGTWRTLQKAVDRVAADMNAQGVAMTSNALAKCGHAVPEGTWKTLQKAVDREYRVDSF